MQKTKFLIFVLLLILILLECIVRINWEEPIRTYEQGMLIKNNFSGFSLNPGFKGNILGMDGEKLTISVEINSKGLRDKERDYERGANQKRVLILGDTIAFGMRVPFEETLSFLVEEELRAEGYNLEVINLGVPAYQPIQEFQLYFSEGYKYDPNIVVVLLAMSDIEPVEIEKIKNHFDTYGDLYIPDTKIESLIKKACHTCTLAYSLYYNRDRGYTNDGFLRYVYNQWANQTAFEQLFSDLREFNTILKTENKTLIVAMYPYIIQMSLDENYGYAPQEAVRDICSGEELQFIDFSMMVDNEKYKSYFTPEGKSASSEGHKKMAKILSSALREKL